LNVLGARVVRFVPDMYGSTGSALHHGLPTDRFVVMCDTTDLACHRPITLDDADASTPVVTAVEQPGDRGPAHGVERASRLRLESPTDFAQLLAESPSDAYAWHAATREQLQWALANRYTVTGLRRDPSTARSFYMLEVPP
jgi:predicted GNAT superfamily acetyltransferase